MANGKLTHAKNETNQINENKSKHRAVNTMRWLNWSKSFGCLELDVGEGERRQAGRKKRTDFRVSPAIAERNCKVRCFRHFHRGIGTRTTNVVPSSVYSINAVAQRCLSFCRHIRLQLPSFFFNVRCKYLLQIHWRRKQSRWKALTTMT